MLASIVFAKEAGHAHTTRTKLEGVIDRESPNTDHRFLLLRYLSIKNYIQNLILSFNTNRDERWQAEDIRRISKKQRDDEFRRLLMLTTVHIAQAYGANSEHAHRNSVSSTPSVVCMFLRACALAVSNRANMKNAHQFGNLRRTDGWCT